MPAPPNVATNLCVQVVQILLAAALLSATAVTTWRSTRSTGATLGATALALAVLKTVYMKHRKYQYRKKCTLPYIQYREGYTNL